MSVVVVLVAWLLAPAVDPVPRAHVAPAPGASAESAPARPPTAAVGRELLGDANTLVYRSDAVTVPGTDDDARVTWQINRTRGTWQSYLLATSEDLPDRLFHHGFTITLGPPRQARRGQGGEPPPPLP